MGGPEKAIVANAAQAEPKRATWRSLVEQYTEDQGVGMHLCNRVPRKAVMMCTARLDRRAVSP